MELTEKQISLATMYAKKAGLEPSTVIDWLTSGEVTFTQLASGILGTLVR